MIKARVLAGARSGWVLAVFALVVVTVGVAACGSKGGSSSNATPANTIVGAGATFPYPLYSQWGTDYAGLSSVKLNYQAIGSGGGIAAIEAKTVDFGASDAPLTEADLTTNALVQFPMVVGGAVLIVNLPGIGAGDLKLTPDLVAKIYMGEITKWNDPAIKAVNPGLSLPSTAVSVVHRSDGSGTTWIFTNYLTAAAPSIWTVGAGTEVNWPVGVGAKGSTAVAASVKQLNGAIGYVEYAYAKQTGLAWTQLQNKDGKFVSPGLQAFAAAATGVDWKKAPGFAPTLVDQPGPTTWPLTGASFILIQQQQQDAARAQQMLKFFDWAYRNGGTSAKTLDFMPIPPQIYKQVEKLWETVTISGTPVWPA
jgi:phosphate transport system substrate-binding protein